MDANILTKDIILQEQIEKSVVNPKCGIYFLIKNNNIIYVGQSIDIWSRVMTHSLDIEKDFDYFSCHFCDKPYLDELELKYILKFKPSLNRNLPPNNQYMTKQQLLKNLKIPVKILNQIISQVSPFFCNSDIYTYYDVDEIKNRWI